MHPQTAKLLAGVLAIVAAIVGVLFKGTEVSMATLFGVLIGKEFMGRTGDVSVTTHPDDMPSGK